MVDLKSEFVLLEDNSDELFSADIEGISNWVSQQCGSWNAQVLTADERLKAAQFSRVSIGRLTLSTVRWGVKARTEFLDGNNVLVVNLPLVGHVQMSIDGGRTVETGPNEARIYKRNVPQTSIVSKGHASISLIVPLDLIEQRAQSYYGGAIENTVEFSPTLDLRTSAGHNILFLTKYLVRNLVAQQSARTEPSVTESLTDLVVSQLLLNLPHNHTHTTHVSSAGAVPKVVRLAEDYMQAHAQKPITIEELAKAAGCSERTLHKAFRTFRGTTPIATLRSIRLEGARRDLQNDSESVMQVALKWGFSNPGRFAQAYAKQFGEMPSAARALLSARTV